MSDTEFITWWAPCPACSVDAKWRRANPYVSPRVELQIFCPVCPADPVGDMLEPVPLPPAAVTWNYGARNTTEGEVA